MKEENTIKTKVYCWFAKAQLFTLLFKKQKLNKKQAPPDLQKDATPKS